MNLTERHEALRLSLLARHACLASRHQAHIDCTIQFYKLLHYVTRIYQSLTSIY